MKRVDVGLVEPGEQQRPRDRLARQRGEGRPQRVGRGRIDVAARADDHDPALGELAGHELQEQQRRLVRRVQVVEHQHERLRDRDALQERGQGIEQPEARSLGFGPGGRRQVGDDVAQLRQQLGEVRRSRPQLPAQRAGLGPEDVGAQRLHPRPVGGGAAGLPAATDQDERAARPGERSELLGEAALADARLADEQEQAPVAGDGVLEAGGQLRELAVATDEGAGDDLRRWLLDRGEIEPRILRQDRALELAQPLARLDPQVVGQRAACVAVGLQRVGLAVAPVQREHELRPEPLPIGVLGDHPLEPAEQGGVAAQRQFRLGQQLQRRDALLDEPRDLALGERLEGQIRQRAPAPERQRLLEHRRRPRRAARGQLAAALPDQALEPVRVDALGIEPELVAVLAGLDLPAAPERAAQPRDVDLHGLGGRGRRTLAPQLVDQPVAAERLAGVQEQHRQQRPLPGAADGHHAVAVDDLERTEDAEFDAGRVTSHATVPHRVLPR